MKILELNIDKQIEETFAVLMRIGRMWLKFKNTNCTAKRKTKQC